MTGRPTTRRATRRGTKAAPTPRSSSGSPKTAWPARSSFRAAVRDMMCAPLRQTRRQRLLGSTLLLLQRPPLSDFRKQATRHISPRISFADPRLLRARSTRFSNTPASAQSRRTDAPTTPARFQLPSSRAAYSWRSSTGIPRIAESPARRSAARWMKWTPCSERIFCSSTKKPTSRLSKAAKTARSCA